MARNTALAFGFVCLLAFAMTTQASCVENCNITNTICQNNWVVDKYVCQQGMDRCINRCFQNSTFGNNTYASNCTEVMRYCPYVSNWTCQNIVNRCAEAAFKPKISYYNWNAYECGWQCNDATQLCNYTQYINWYQCQNWTNGCFNNCFNYDFDNYNPYNPYYPNNTWNSTWNLQSSNKVSAFLKSHKQAPTLDNISCSQCQDLTAKVELVIKDHGCDQAFEAEVTKMASSIFGNDRHAQKVIQRLVKRCERLEDLLSRGQNLSKVCSHLEIC